jgi:peptidoglycan/xylan/chitin deacetylase (PgdA/CDA1 family)
MMLRIPLSMMSMQGRRGRLSILIFHRVLPDADPLFPDVPTAAEFETRMRWVKDWFNVLPLGPAVDALFSGSIPSRALAITFDDGYADNERVAAPILKRLGMCATFFVSTGFLGGGCMWNDRIIEAIRGAPGTQLDLGEADLGMHSIDKPEARRAAIDAVLTAVKHLEPGERTRVTDLIAVRTGGRAAPRLMMKPDQVRNLRALGMEVGAHTVTHPILTRLGSDAAREEMRRSRGELEQILGERVGLFAYPNGVPAQDYAAEHAAMARECGFDAAVSTAWGAASASSDRFQLPRFTPWDRTRLRYGVRLLDNLRRRERIAG